MDTYDSSLTHYDNINPLDTCTTHMKNLHLSGNMQLNDDRTLAFGSGGIVDAYVKGDGSNLIFYDDTVGAEKTLTELLAGGVTLDTAFEAQKYIDGSTSSGAANAFSVGGAAADDKVEIYHTGTEAHINARADDLYITAAGGDIQFDNENLVTTGTLTVRGIINTTTVIDTTAQLQIGADNTKLTMGADDDADSYLQFDSANIDIYSAGGIDFLTGGDTDSYMTLTTTSNVPIIGTSGTCNLKITASSGTVDFDDDNITHTGTITTKGITCTTAAITSSAGYALGANDVDFTFGAGAPSGVYYNAVTGLMLYDDVLGTSIALAALAGNILTSPVVTGDLTITDGRLVWTDAADEVAGTFTFSNVTNDGIDVVANSITTANLIHAQSTSVTSGSIFTATVDESVGGAGFSGNYFEATNSTGGATVFSVAKYGATTIAGAAQDVLTLTLGNLQMTNGDIDMDRGKIEVNTIDDEQSYIVRTNDVGTNPVFKVQNAHATGGVVLHVDQDATGDVNALQVDNAGTGFSVTTTAAAAGGEGYEYIAATSGTGIAFLADGATGSWIGAAATGLIHASSDGALADVSASLLYLSYSGNAGGANQAGSCMNVVETGAASGTSYAVGINSTNNNGMNVAVGAVGKTNLNLTGVTLQTAKILNVDGTTGDGWIGAAGTGMLHLASDGALANAGASLIYSTFTGNTAAVVPAGSCAYFYENGTIAAGGYAVGIKSTGGHALNVETAGAGYTNINVVGVSDQTANMLNLDGSTGGNGWIGADGKAILAITTDGAFAHANASCLNITHSGTAQAASMGTSLRIVDSSTPGAGSYSVYISATNASMEAIKVDDGIVVVDETVTASKGIITLALDTDITNPPTDTELDNATDAQTQKDGCIVFVDDGGAHANAHLCVHDGTKWWYVTMTACDPGV